MTTVVTTASGISVITSAAGPTSAAPAGADRSIQVNDAGSLGAVAGCTIDTDGALTCKVFQSISNGGSAFIAPQNSGTLLWGSTVCPTLGFYAGGQVAQIGTTAAELHNLGSGDYLTLACGPATIHGAIGQTADLQRWTTSGGTVLASVSASGAVECPQLVVADAVAFFGVSPLGQQALAVPADNGNPTTGDASLIANLQSRVMALENLLTGFGFAVPALGSYLLFVGNSLTASSRCSVGAGTITGTSYPARTLAHLGVGWTGRNTGVPGLKLSQMNSAPYPAEYAGAFDPATYPTRQAAVLEGGANDLILDTASDATINSRMTALNATVTGQGWKTYLMTMTPALDTGANFIPVNFNAVRNAVNCYRRTNYGVLGFDGIVDVAADSVIGPDSAPSNPTYYSPDTGFVIHMTDAGYQIQADIAAASVLAGRVFTPQFVSGIALGLDHSVATCQDTTLGTAAAAGQLLGGWQGAVLRATQGTSGNRPTVQAAGIQFGAGKSLLLESAVSIAGDFTVYGVFDRPAAGQAVWLLGDSTTVAGIVLHTDNNIYCQTANGVCALGVISTTGTGVMVRVVRRGTTVSASVTGITESTLSGIGGTQDGALVCDTVAARTKSGAELYTDSATRLQQLWVFAGDVTATADDRKVRNWLIARGATDIP